MSVTFLVTGFAPFGEHLVNSSWEALCCLAPHWPEDIVARRLPVDHQAAHALLRQWLCELEPRAVLCTGLAKGQSFRIERRARRPRELAVPGAPELKGRWPWQEMRLALEGAGVSAIDSEDAGAYVCESTYWSLLSAAPLGRPVEYAAFLHVPPLSPELRAETVAAAVWSVVEARRNALNCPMPPES